MNILRKYFFGIFVLMVTVCPVMAITENFQSWGSSVFTPVANNEMTPNIVLGSNNDVGLYASFYYGATGGNPGFININPVLFSYAAWDINNGGYSPVSSIYLEDSGHNVIASQGSPVGTGRFEVNIVGMQPKYYLNGVLYNTGPVLNIYPSYLDVGQGGESGTGNFDNIVIGGTDPHVVGALPSNWTIIKDLLNPTANGVYAWNNATQAWVLQNSNYFYIDADTSSQQSASSETFNILNTQTGTVVYTKTISNQASPQNTLQIPVSTFLNTSGVSTGQYTAEFAGYPASAAYFWVISQGAAINWSQTNYPQNTNGGITYQISNSYYQTSSYTYSIAIVNTAGSTLQTFALNTQSGTETVSLNSATYPAGVYYAEVLATPVGGGTASIMTYAAMQITVLDYISGFVNDAQMALPLVNAYVNVTQGLVNQAVLTSATGQYNLTQGWSVGAALTMVTNLTGYTNDAETFTPLAAGNINRNISLLSTSPSYSGTAVGGVVTDNQYYNPIPGATIYLANTTSSQQFSNSTNNAGYFYLNGLTHSYCYTESGKKAGYANLTLPTVCV
jgi:hypothetical protein